MRIYVIGPLSADHPREVLKNVNSAIDAGIEIMKKGHSVYIPHFFHYMHLRPNCPFEYEEYMRNDLEWLKVSDAVLVLGNSPGSNRELNFARRLGLKIFKSLEEIPDSDSHEQTR